MVSRRTNSTQHSRVKSNENGVHKPKPKPRARAKPARTPTYESSDDEFDNSDEIFTRSSDSEEIDSELEDFIVNDSDVSDDEYDPDECEQEMLRESSKYIVSGKRTRKPVTRYTDPRMVALYTQDVDVDEYFDTEETDSQRVREHSDEESEFDTEEYTEEEDTDDDDDDYYED